MISGAFVLGGVMMSGLRSRSLGLLCVVLIAGCQRDCRNVDDGEDSDARVEEDFYRPDTGPRDDGRRDGGDNPSDGGGMDGGPGDSGIPGDAGKPDAGADADVLCPAPPPMPLGTANAPRSVAYASLPFFGNVDWRGLAFIELTGLTAGTRYIVTLGGSDQLMLLTYPDDSSFSTATCTGYSGANLPATCIITPTGSTFHIAVDAVLDSSTFQLNVRQVPENPAPDWSNPIAFALETLPVSVTAVAFEQSNYEITGLTPGQQYVISASDAREAIALAVKTELSATQPYDIQRGTNPQVVATATGTSLYVVLLGTAFGATADLSVTTSSEVSQGTLEAPITASPATLPLTGEVAASRSIESDPSLRGRSIYAITDLQAGTHLLHMTAEPGIALIAYGDRSDYLGPPACTAIVEDGEQTGECSVTITGATLYFAAINVGGDGSPLAFELSDAPHHSEGTPLDRALYSAGDSGFAGGVSASTPSYYRLQDVRAGTRYRFSLAGVLTSELSVTIYEPNHADQPICVFSTASSISECSFTPSGTLLDIDVQSQPDIYSNRNVGSAFLFRAEVTGGSGVGSEASPFRFSCGSDEYVGEVGSSGYSIFEVGGLTPGAAYVATIDEASGPYNLMISNRNSWSGEVVCATGDEGIAGRCKSASSDTGKIYVRVQSSALISFALRVNAATQGSEGTSGVPFVIDRSAMPYVGRVGGAAPSYYVVTGLGAGKPYKLRVLSEQETTLLSMWSTSTFAGAQLFSLGTPPGFPSETSFSPIENAAYFTVSLDPEADGVTSFRLEIVPE
jgi:hypothetical protein